VKDYLFWFDMPGEHIARRSCSFHDQTFSPAAYVDWIDGFIRFNGIRIVTKWASALNETWRQQATSSNRRC
jgi:hypothetical protein